MAYDRPIYAYQVPEGERAERVRHNSDLCIIDEADHFIRGLLDLPSMARIPAHLMQHLPLILLFSVLTSGIANAQLAGGSGDAASTARPVVVAAEEGDVSVAESGTMLQFKVGSVSNGAQRTMAAKFTVPPGHETVTHLHEIDEETFYITAGEFTVTLGDEVFTAGPGDIVFAPAGTWMSFANRTESEASGLILLSRAETEECFRVLFLAESDEAARMAAVAQCRLKFPPAQLKE